MRKLALVATAGIALIALAVIGACSTTFTNVLNVLAPIAPSLSAYIPQEVAKYVSEPIAPVAIAYLAKEASSVLLKPIAPAIIAYLPSMRSASLLKPITPALNVSRPAKETRYATAPIAPAFLIGRLVGNLSTPYADSLSATLSHIEGDFPIASKAVVLEVPNTTYIQKTANVTVKVIDPATGKVDKTFTGWVRVTIDNGTPIDAYISNGVGSVTITFTSVGKHSIKVSLLSGAGGWGSKGSMGGWNPDDVPGYVVAPSNITVKASTETTLIPTKIVLTKFKYEWMNKTHVSIMLKGYVVDATGNRVPGGTIKIRVLKGSWLNAGAVSVSKNGEFMWRGTVDPPTSAWLNLTYVPNSTIYLSSSKQLPLFEAQAVGRALGGKASPIQPYLAVAWLAPALASATALACLLRKRGKEGRA